VIESDLSRGVFLRAAAPARQVRADAQGSRTRAAETEHAQQERASI
jgi:hypothetical protein